MINEERFIVHKWVWLIVCFNLPFTEETLPQSKAVIDPVFKLTELGSSSTQNVQTLLLNESLYESGGHK